MKGWIRVDFQPTVHHGEVKVHQIAAKEGTTYRTRQDIDARSTLQFSLTMNIGESAIIAAAVPHRPGSMGNWFFCRDEDGHSRRRLLVVQSDQPDHTR